VVFSFRFEPRGGLRAGEVVTEAELNYVGIANGGRDEAATTQFGTTPGTNSSPAANNYSTAGWQARAPESKRLARKPRQARLAESLAFFEFLRAEMPAILARWREQRTTRSPNPGRARR